ncbi:MAG: hypothetical protein V4547_00970 [Bacteroidota bacterium]
MVDQTYLPSKTVTLKDDNLIAASAESTAPKSNVSVKDSYLSHKTIILNAALNEIKKEEKPKEELLGSVIKPSSFTSTIELKIDETSQKAINTVNTITTEKVEIITKEVQSGIANVANALNAAVKGNYPSHKTLVLNPEAATENKVEKLKEELLNTTIKPPSFPSSIESKIDETSQKAINTVNTITTEKVEIITKEVQSGITNVGNTLNAAVKGNYPSHKTLVLTPEVTVEKIAEKLKEDVLSKINIPSLSPLNIDSKDDYPAHKSISLTDNTITKVENVLDSKIAELKTTITKEEQTIVNTIETNITGSILTDKLSEQKTELVSKVNIVTNEAVNQVIDTAEGFGLKVDKNTSYPSHKTILINTERSTSTAVSDKKELPDQAIVSANTGTEGSTILKRTESASSNYPQHKTYFFVKEENKTLAENDGVSATETSSSVPPVKKEAAVLQTNAKQSADTSLTKAKKPVLWIALSSGILIASAATIGFLYNQQNTLKNEISALKVNNETLTDSVMKLRRDKLQFDDIIVGAGTIDPKNKITLLENATEAEALRVCFSINSNQYATIGKKEVFIRLIDPNNNVLIKSKESLFDYKGNKIPFSLKQEVEYKKEELMLCFDFKPEEKLQKGLYKAEIYNDGVLDLKGSFELK